MTSFNPGMCVGKSKAECRKLIMDSWADMMYDLYMNPQFSNAKFPVFPVEMPYVFMNRPRHTIIPLRNLPMVRRGDNPASLSERVFGGVPPIQEIFFTDE